MSDLGDCHWSVPDPVPAGEDAAFEAAVAELDGRVATWPTPQRSVNDTFPPRHTEETQ